MFYIKRYCVFEIADYNIRKLIIETMETKKILLSIVCAICTMVYGCTNDKVTYEGYVRDAETGEPLNEVNITLLTKKEKNAVNVKTNSDGYYKLVFPYLDSIVKIGYSLNPYRGVLKETKIPRKEYKNNKGNIKSPDVMLNIVNSPHMVYYKGRVVDSSNQKPIPEVNVGVSGSILFTTSKAGKYALGFCKGQTKQKLFFQKEGYITVEYDTILQPLGVIMLAPDVVMQKVKE